MATTHAADDASRPSGPQARSQMVRAVFDLVADTYEEVGVPWFEPIAAGLVEAVDPQPGETVLDVGCGKGAATFPIARRIMPGGRVTAIDLSPAMVEHGRQQATARGVQNIDWLVMDAAEPALPAQRYDLLASSLVLFFLPDPVAALRAWRGLLVAGGRIGLTTFGRPAPVVGEFDALFRPHLPPQMLDARASGAEGPFASDAGVAELLTEAGFADVTTTHFEVGLAFPDVQTWARWSQSHGQRAMWQFVPGSERTAVLDRAAEVLEAHRGPDGMTRSGNEIRVTLARC